MGGKKIISPSKDELEKLYEQGYVLTRLPKYTFHQTRSARINLENFNLSSENRRILRKNEGLEIVKEKIPFTKYSWQIGKMAKDFYTEKFGPKIMSANKIKELLTVKDKSGFNTLLVYKIKNEIVGYALCLETENFLHYSYPFYKTEISKDLGLGMMISAVNLTKTENKKFIYLGSLQRPTDIYKFQFIGFEWFNGENQKWQTTSSRADLFSILNK